MDILLQTLGQKKSKKRYIAHDMIDKISCEDIKVLVAEDSIPNQELLKVHLESLGCIPEFAVNGQEAIDLLKKKSYDICFMDLHMPVIDGLAATEIIRKNLKLSIPIVALTAAEVDEEKERCYKIGMQDYL